MSWWWTGKPGVLQSMGSQRVGYNWVNWTDSMWDLSSLTRDQTHAPCSGSTEPQPLNHQGRPCRHILKSFIVSWHKLDSPEILNLLILKNWHNTRKTQCFSLCVIKCICFGFLVCAHQWLSLEISYFFPCCNYKLGVAGLRGHVKVQCRSICPGSFSRLEEELQEN